MVAAVGLDGVVDAIVVPGGVVVAPEVARETDVVGVVGVVEFDGTVVPVSSRSLSSGTLAFVVTDALLVVTLPLPLDPLPLDPLVPEPLVPEPLVPEPLVPELLVPEPLVPDPLVPDPPDEEIPVNATERLEAAEAGPVAVIDATRHTETRTFETKGALTRRDETARARTRRTARTRASAPGEIVRTGFTGFLRNSVRTSARPGSGFRRLSNGK